MRRRPVGRSLAQQAYALRARIPEGVVALSRDRLQWTSSITPTALSRTYLIELCYRRGHMPEVRVRRPALEPRRGETLPHVYRGGVLCLHRDGEWNDGLLLVDTIVPWTAEWLLFYEIWHATGEWHGGGEWPPVEASHSATMTVAEQRTRTEIVSVMPSSVDA